MVNHSNCYRAEYDKIYKLKMMQYYTNCEKYT